MSLIKRISNYLDDIRVVYKVFLFIAILFYFVYQALTGANGYKSYLVIKQQVITRQNELDKLKCQLNELKQKVDLLSDNALDLDILEERCRAILNYSYSSDIIIRSKSVF